MFFIQAKKNAVKKIRVVFPNSILGPLQLKDWFPDMKRPGVFFGVLKMPGIQTRGFLLAFLG